MLNVLCDFHHTDLFRSMIFLFEKRFGMRLFRPFGQDWWEHGYFYHPDSFYGKHCLTKDAFHRHHLREDEGPSHYPYGDDAKNWSWIGLEEASQKIDLIITTLPSNEVAFTKFQNERRPRAGIIRYIGNEEEYPSELSRNLLCANLKVYRKLHKQYNSVFFHPEFDTAMYAWSEPPALEKPVLRTFLNYIYHSAPQSDKNLLYAHKNRLRDKVFFYMHGLGTPPPGIELAPEEPLWKRIRETHGDHFEMPDLTRCDGEPRTHGEISALMKQTNIAWHVKTADGYGFALHQLYASGRPVICQRDNYKDKTGGLLLRDKKTCVFLEGNLEEDMKKVLYYLRPDRNFKMCREAHKAFRKNVDFDREASQIKKFIARVK